MAAVEVLLKVPGGTKIDRRGKPAVGSGPRVLVVGPTHEEVVGKGKARRAREALTLTLETHVEPTFVAVPVVVVGPQTHRPTPARVDVRQQLGVPVLPDGHVITQVLQEEPQVAPVAVARQQHPLTLFFLMQRKPPKRQGQRRRDLSKLQVERAADHLVVGHHDGLGQVEMKVWVLGVAGGELATPDVDRFVGLPFGLPRMEHRALFLGHCVRTQPLAGAEIVAQLILAERLSVVLEHRPTDPGPEAVPRPKGTHLVVVQPQHNAVGRQGHRTTLHPSVSGEVTHGAVHPEIDVVGAVIDRVVLGCNQWIYQHP